MQRPVQIGDGGRVTLLPGYPRFVGIILRVPKSVEIPLALLNRFVETLCLAA
jgi:hypothetical protein